MTLLLLKRFGQVVYRMLFNLYLSNGFHNWIKVMDFGEEDRNYLFLSVHHFNVMLIYLITGNVIFDHHISLLQSTVFPFVIKYLEGDTLRLCKYSFFAH